VQSLKINYLLNEANLTPGSSSFRVSTRVLKQAQVPPDSLRTLAWISSGTQPFYVPVILGQNSSEYQFVFFTERSASFPKLEIVRVKDGQRVYKNPRSSSQAAGEVFVNWDGRKQPAGRYELRITALQEQEGKPPKPLSQVITFEHNPSWFK
jgi:flagellar basal-body rod modification protein FlgD